MEFDALPPSPDFLRLTLLGLVTLCGMVAHADMRRNPMVGK